MKIAVIIGRFQPVHTEHLNVLFRTALLEYDKVIVLIGSANQARSVKNPFTWNERRWMIREGCKDIVSNVSDFGAYLEKLVFLSLLDFPYNDARWIKQVYDQIRTVHNKNSDITILGVEKDSSSWYLKHFPEFAYRPLTMNHNISATNIRAELFEKINPDNISELTPSVQKVLNQFIQVREKEYEWLCHEYETSKQAAVVLAFKKADGTLVEAPYKPIAYCVDNLVIHKNKILLVKRRKAPGQGLWALPGGHLEPYEWVIDGALRELNEETNLCLWITLCHPDKEANPRTWITGPHSLSKDFLSKTQEFDCPSRSLVGRKLTKVFQWNLPDFIDTTAQAADDAEDVNWFSLNQISEMDLHDDHKDIIYIMLGL